MATAAAWVRSLSCKSTAVADAVYSPPVPPLKKHPLAPVKGSAASVPAKESRRSRSLEQERPAKTPKKRPSRKKPKQLTAQLAASPMPSPKRPSSAAFLDMTELPEGHPSRRVVELIFASGWGRAADDATEPEAEVEALFRVRSTARAVAWFEDARRAAILARGADARCAADGNEMMRFQCRAPEDDGNDQVICAAVATTGPSSSAVRTFAGCATAHVGAGGAEGRRGMLVCRVIAGRVRRAADNDEPPCRAGEHEYDSVEAGCGELVVLDRRAVLPCFLVVYRVKPALDGSSSRRSSR